jgi:hypothetical protein
MPTICLLGNLNGEDHLGDSGIDGKILLEWISGKYGGRVWTGCIWLWIQTNDEPL